jgi:hypothetical protein
MAACAAFAATNVRHEHHDHDLEVARTTFRDEVLTQNRGSSSRCETLRTDNPVTPLAGFLRSLVYTQTVYPDTETVTMATKKRSSKKKVAKKAKKKARRKASKKR